MSTPSKPTPTPAAANSGRMQMPAAVPKPLPQPTVHNGRPAGGKHVPSGVDGPGGPYDCSIAVGSNITGTPGATAESEEVLNAAPWVAVNPNSSQWIPPVD